MIQILEKIANMSSARQIVSCSRAVLNKVCTSRRPTSSTQFGLSRPSNSKSSFHTTTYIMASRTIDSEVVSNITHKENELTNQPDPVKGGPTAQAQKHLGESVNNPDAVADVVKGEKKITNQDAPIQGGPAAFIMSEAAQNSNQVRRFFNHAVSLVGDNDLVQANL